MVLATLGVFAALVPQAQADTTLPVWTCRASAAYVELPSVLGTTRAEPVLANGFPRTGALADSEQCASSDAGVQDVSLLPAAGGGLNTPPLITLNGAYARTRLSPQIAAARDQDVLAQGGVVRDTRIVVGGITIETDAVTAEATGDCTGTPATTPTLSGTSTFLNLRINGIPIQLGPNGQPIIPLSLVPLVRISVNQQIRAGVGTADESLTQRALQVEVLTTGVTAPLATVVVGEAKADRHGAVCAPVVPQTCATGVAVPGSSPLVCQQVVTAPCPANTTANPQGACILTVPAPCGAGTTASGGTCIVTPTTCPTGTVRDPNSSACILLVQRPCPAGAIADPATRVCVLRVGGGGTTGASNGENGRIGSSDGPRATCGRLAMRFVRGRRNLGRSHTSRFGTRTVTRGRLVTCGSNPRPIVGARIDVVHVLSGNKRRRKTGLRSRANGLLTLILPIDLRSRKIDYAYRPDLRTSRVTSRVTLSLTVKNRAGRVLR